MGNSTQFSQSDRVKVMYPAVAEALAIPVMVTSLANPPEANAFSSSEPE
jgi:hypothetical protein